MNPMPDFWKGHGHFFYKDPLFGPNWICACGEMRDRFGRPVVTPAASG